MEWIRTSSLCNAALNLTNAVQENVSPEQQESLTGHASVAKIDIDLREIYFLILHFLSTGPCKRTFGHLRDELLGNQLLPRRYHSWCSRSGECSGHADDDGISFPLNYDDLVERYPHIEKDHLVKLLKQLILHSSSPLHGRVEGNAPNAADVPTLLGSGSFSLLDCDKNMEHQQARSVASYLRWPHMHADQVHGLSLREIGGGFTKHHRAPSSCSACYAIAKPTTMVQKMQNIKKLRGHRNAVYCAIFDRSGRYVITGSDDRLVKIWSMETAFCLASCRGHEGDITDLAVSSNNVLVASASNDFVIRVWRLPDGAPTSVLRGHTGAVTAIAFSPRAATFYHLLSSSDDGTCRIWDARSSQFIPRIYVPRPSDAITGQSHFPSNSVASTSNASQSRQILCCAYNANGTVFVTGSSDSNARVWSALKHSADDTEQPMHELDVLRGHENDVNYAQFSGCAVAPRSSVSDSLKEDIFPKFKNSWFGHDNIVTCSRDGSAIIWTPRSRKSHGKSGRWTKAYHLKVPPPPRPPLPRRGGPRQRLLPTPRGVNMIIWSLDNRFVLAAIMDCRICVWNAADGSLVHCLTGHTESSYVLDVHPFNPRIAMSAGYDGRTIIWDIWEGLPIKIYEIGRFKLVDGKFSQDGTSIVLSDEVGQIYFLNTGQGESQKDAKYDQFFLGDYRPLFCDTNGIAFDQETQLTSYHRNLQDLLCDSSMIPYPEPYQTMYQQRRLGALGIEWHPSSIRFAVGPDFSLGQDYIMPPLEDLDRMMEPLPEFIDAMYWEPENEVLSDDNDSEYNAEENSADGARVNLSSSSSSELECSSEDSDVEHIPNDSHHLKRRRKHRKVEPATSSGRRVKKRILDENDGSISVWKRTKNGRSGLKASKRKSSDAEALRPQRVAARNARSLLSKISESSSDGGYEDELSDSSNSESISQNLHIQGSESDRSFLSGHEVAKQSEMPESQWNDKQKKKLIFKISVKKPVESEKSIDVISQTDFEQMPSKPSEEDHKLSAVSICSRERGSSSATANATSRAEDILDFIDTRQSEKAQCKSDESLDQKQNMVRWDGEMPLNGSTEFTTCNVNEEGQTGFSRDEDQPRPEALSGQLVNGQGGIRNSEEAMEIPSKKIGKLRLRLRQPRSTLELEPVTEADGVGDFAVERSSINQIVGLGTTQGSGASGPEVMMRENLYDIVESPAAGYEYGEPATDEIRRKRSMKMKATSSESNVRSNKLCVRLGHGSMEALKKQDNRSKRVYDNKPLEEWPSSSKFGVRSSRSARSSQNSNFASKQSLQATSQVNKLPKKLSWLMLPEDEGGTDYIPQLGDEVVYFTQGHQEFLSSRGSTNRDHSRLLPRHLKAAEICKVEKLDYDTYPGSGESCCKLTLRLLDPPAHVSCQEFQLTLPDLIDFPDFIVERARFEAALRRCWQIGDKCLVWWRNDSVEGGCWWEGIIQSSRAKSDEFPDSPWERYEVLYENDEVEHHCPWELYDRDFSLENPSIDEEIREKLLSGFARLEKSVSRHRDNYGIQKLNEAAEKMDFCNRFPVPLYPELIRVRLERHYYRSIEAFKHDMNVMLSNAESYFARNKQVLSKTRHLRDWFTRTLEKVSET